jgi:choline-phosphate cytidylyltransferase
VPEAPWIIDAAFIEKYQIDYVAHDADPYAATGHDDVYAYAKNQGKRSLNNTSLVSTIKIDDR